MLRLKDEISYLLSTLTDLDQLQIKELLEEPPDKSMGNLSFPCFVLAKTEKKPPPQIAADLAQKLSEQKRTYWTKVENKGPYINFFMNYYAVGKELIPELLENDLLAKWCNVGNGKTVVIDYSAPNIAKPFGIGHLRSTIIGNALYLIYQALGYNCIGINHLGDWGTQFGKLLAAYRLWGDEEKFKKDPVNYAYELYVKFHEEAELDDSLEDTAREWFRQLEEGEKEATDLWKTFCDFSLEEFKEVYAMLGIDFDYFLGESFYNPHLEETISLIKAKGITKVSEGALIVDLEPYELPSIVLRKKDGTNLYITRDLAAAIYRYQTFDFTYMLYVVGSEQSLHFQQLFKILELMGFEWAQQCYHIPFGLIRFKEGRMSTREGNIILLREVIEKAKKFAYQIIEEKNPELANKEKAAHAVGVGAIKFGDLCNDRVKDIDFEWEKVLDFSGDTAPYIQYSHARICSILRKAKSEQKEVTINSNFYEAMEGFSFQLEREEEKDLLRALSMLPDILLQGAATNKPSYLARYLVEVAREFSRFYHNCPVLSVEGDKFQSRILLIQATQEVLAKGLKLLGIEALEEM